jgi:hypothetical protein
VTATGFDDEGIPMSTVIISAMRVIHVWEDTGMNALRSVFAELGAAIDLLEDAVAEASVPDGNPTVLTGRSQRPVLRVEGALEADGPR